MSENTQNTQRTATERLNDLEQGYVGMFNTLNNMSRDMAVIKEAIKLLGNKVDSIVKASSRGEALTDDNIAKIMIENNEQELKEKVEALKQQGLLAETDVATDSTFMVGKEVSETGEVVNPRLQFAVTSFNDSIKSKLIGSKIGDLIEIEEGKLKLQVTELYNIVAPAATQNQAPTQA